MYTYMYISCLQYDESEISFYSPLSIFLHIFIAKKVIKKIYEIYEKLKEIKIRH